MPDKENLKRKREKIFLKQKMKDIKKKKLKTFITSEKILNKSE